MNTNQLKKFAQDARRKLLTQVGAKLEYVLTHDTAELREKARQLKALKDELARTGKPQLIEKVAYTWFNRLMALRFMDANDFQPSGLRIVSPKDGHSLPQLLDEAKQGGLVTGEWESVIGRVNDLLDGRLPSSNPQNEAYRLLLIAACNGLHQQFPFLFERINDHTELLLPDDLTSEFSIVHDVVQGMPTDDCQQVEIIGWLYQFYISEKKDEVFASKDKVSKADIPAATQLFTPRWIVEYMVQNSLGKLWLQNRPNSQLREHMPYFIESASQQAGDYLRVGSPEDITLLDQACGSGHILVYAFELLTKIYEEEGYNPADIPRLILEKNLYGFEIDGRAAQLAGLALLMKARGYYRRLFRKEAPVPHILQFEDVAFAEGELEGYLRSVKLDMFSQDLLADLRQFEQATNYGSLLRIRTQDLPNVQRELPTPDLFLLDTHQKVLSAFRQMELLGRKFHCVVDNPPYMGSGNMNTKLADFVKTHYPNGKADLMACFMEAGMNILLPNGFLGMINQQSWMFLSSYEELRKKIISDYFIETLVQVGYNSFPELNSKVVQACTFVINKKTSVGKKGVYVNLNDAAQSADKKLVFEAKIKAGEFYKSNQKDFEKMPGSPIGYWTSESIKKLFGENERIGKVSSPKKGLDTGENERFLRIWYEIPHIYIELKCKNKSESENSNATWYPINRGGGFRKWYGNKDYLIYWKKNGDLIKSVKNPNGQIRANLRSEQYYFMECVTWSAISSFGFSSRYCEIGGLFGAGGYSLFADKSILKLIQGYFSSVVAKHLLKIISPTLNFEAGNIADLPFVSEIPNKAELVLSIEDSIGISKHEWNSRETSWDFPQSELLRLRGQDLEESYDLYCQYWTKKFHQLHRNEEELNRQFIEIYGLQDELTPDVPLEDITILKEETRIEQGQLVFDAQEVMAQFVSYAVGCMMGRYSLDKEGLVLANQGETLTDYWQKLGIPQPPAPKGESTRFVPDEDAIIPVLDDEWFEDDIVGRFHAFLKAAFGERDFRRNLAFLEAKLGKDLRKYFVKDFYADHVQRYKKRPIYWLFSSPKGSFNVLVYLHRYTPDTLNNLLNHYLREFIQKLRAQRDHFEQVKISGSTAEQTQAIKRIDQLEKMLLDCEQYERDILYPLATERIALDLDDGVLVNYNKLGQAVKEVGGLNDKATKKKVRGFDWVDVSLIK